MSRFGYDGEDGVPYELWENATVRALSSPRGQRTLAELEAALLALPEPRLIDSRLALNGQVCAVGAFVLAKRCAAGESRDEALAWLESREDEGDTDPWTTAEAGKAVGMAYTVAWRVAELNDEQFYSATPEERFAGVLAWARRAQGKEVAA